MNKPKITLSLILGVLAGQVAARAADPLPPTATLTVTASPANGGTVTGSGTYPVWSLQQISASPTSGWTFVGWSDGNPQSPRTITVPAGGETYTAQFNQPPTQVAAPVFTPPPPYTFTGAVEITISCATPGATIYYTLNGTDPTINSILYTGPLTLSAPAILKARGFSSDPNTAPSPITTGDYSLQGWTEKWIRLSSGVPKSIDASRLSLVLGGFISVPENQSALDVVVTDVKYDAPSGGAWDILAKEGSAPSGTYPGGWQLVPDPGVLESSFQPMHIRSPHAGDYFVAAYSNTGEKRVVSYKITATYLPMPPTISVQPQSHAVRVGESVSFSVTASGENLNFQWYKNNSAIAGAKSSTFSVSNVQAVDAGNYQVTVTNPGGSRTSALATLTVATPPIILIQPASQSVGLSGSVTFFVEASGTGPLSYQWFLNGQTISGATEADLLLNNVQTSQAGNYTVAVSGTAGSVTSQPAALTVVETHPADIFALNSGDNTVSVIDSASLTEVAKIGVGVTPTYIAASPDGKEVYVANSRSDDMSVIDRSSGGVIRTIAVGSAPARLSVSRDGQRIFVPNSGSSNFSVIDAESGNVIATVPTPQGPVAIAVHPVRDEIWVSYGQVGTVLEVRSATDFNVIATLRSFTRLYGELYFWPDGSKVLAAEACGWCGRWHLLDGNPSGGSIKVIQPDIWYDNTGSAYGTAINPITGIAYLAKWGQGQGGIPSVREFAGGVLGRELNITGGRPYQMAISPDGSELYVVVRGGPEEFVSVVDTATLQPIASVAVGKSPSGIAVAVAHTVDTPPTDDRRQ